MRLGQRHVIKNLPVTGIDNCPDISFIDRAVEICRNVVYILDKFDLRDLTRKDPIMSELDERKRSAEAVVLDRGHKLGTWRDMVFEQGVSVNTCTVCGRQVTVGIGHYSSRAFGMQGAALDKDYKCRSATDKPRLTKGAHAPVIRRKAKETT
jgi:hypothetical protein